MKKNPVLNFGERKEEGKRGRERGREKQKEGGRERGGRETGSRLTSINGYQHSHKLYSFTLLLTPIALL